MCIRDRYIIIHKLIDGKSLLVESSLTPTKYFLKADKLTYSLLHELIVLAYIIVLLYSLCERLNLWLQKTSVERLLILE